MRRVDVSFLDKIGGLHHLFGGPGADGEGRHQEHKQDTPDPINPSICYAEIHDLSESIYT